MEGVQEKQGSVVDIEDPSWAVRTQEMELSSVSSRLPWRKHTGLNPM